MSKITPEMIEAVAEELRDWVAFRTGYDDTFPIESAREEAKRVLAAAFAVPEKDA